MSWITRWKMSNLRKWGGWHSLEDRENYLLSEIERLENEVNVNSLVTNHWFKCRGGVFYDNKTNMYCQALED